MLMSNPVALAESLMAAACHPIGQNRDLTAQLGVTRSSGPSLYATLQSLRICTQPSRRHRSSVCKAAIGAQKLLSLTPLIPV
jgi:hypothetical protein